MNFVEMFLDYTKDAESPTSYFRWAAYTTLAATMRDNVWIDLVYQKLYPNMYTLILSRRSSLVKKSTPLKTSLRLLEQVRNTRIINGRATIAGIINALLSVQKDTNGNILEGASALIYSEEFSSMLMEDHYATDTLTDWYDTHTRWSSNLNSTGSIDIENLCLSILASSNEELIRSVYDSRALQGGLLARTMLIIESKKRHKNSLMYVVPPTNLDGKLLHHLKSVAQMKGEFFIEEPARQYYDEWYNNFEPLDEDSSTTGIEGRIHTHVLKLAMVKSASDGFSRVIKRHHMEESVIECLDLLPNYRLFSMGSTGAFVKLGRDIIMKLAESEEFTMPKKRLVWHFWGSSDILDKVLDALVQAGNLSVTTRDGELIFTLTKEFIERLKEG